MANQIVRHGWDIGRVQDWLYEASLAHDPQGAAASPRGIHVILTGGAGMKMTHLPLWGGGTAPITTPIIRL